MELLSPGGASSASAAPQINSQPANRALTSSLSLSLSLAPSISVFYYLALPLCQRHLLSPCLLPTPTACPATNGACLSGNCSAFLSVCFPPCPSIFEPVSLSICPVLLSVCLCVSVCVHGCLPVHLPVCLPATLCSQYLSGGKWPGCQPLCQSAPLSACLFVICLCLYLFSCLSICLSTCLPVHLSTIYLFP